MTRKFLWIFLVYILICKISFSQEKNGFDFLVGTWTFEKNKGQIVEIWKKENDSLFSGFSAFVLEKDTMPEESIQLLKIKNEWYYIPTTLKQNLGQPVKFKIIFYGNNEFICENKKHDFPTRIHYRLFGKKLLASIEGLINKKYRKINYDYIKSEN